MTLPSIAILGAGRAGCAIHRALGSTATLLWTRSPETAVRAREEGFPVEPGPALPDLSTKKLVLLTVSDSAVGPLAEAVASVVASGAIVAHVAGALDLDVLAPVAARGIAVGSMHPLVSIATRETALAGAAAAVAASTPVADAILSELAQTLGMFVIRPVGDRARYHAAASLVGNYPAALLEAATTLLTTLGLSRADAIHALGPLLSGAARNAAELGPTRGLTGPIVRGDVDVIRHHLAAIASLPEIDALYRDAGKIATELARQRGSPGTSAIAELLKRKP